MNPASVTLLRPHDSTMKRSLKTFPSVTPSLLSVLGVRRHPKASHGYRTFGRWLIMELVPALLLGYEVWAEALVTGGSCVPGGYVPLPGSSLCSLLPAHHAMSISLPPYPSAWPPATEPGLKHELVNGSSKFQVLRAVSQTGKTGKNIQALLCDGISEISVLALMYLTPWVLSMCLFSLQLTETSGFLYIHAQIKHNIEISVKWNTFYGKSLF